MIASGTRQELVANYKRLGGEPPAWAWKYKPSVPFIGDAYRPVDGLLIYASAENLAWMNRKDVPARFEDERVWDRYRAVYDEAGRTGSSFFPDVGIQPVTDGGLFAAGLFVARKLRVATGDRPREFLETLAVTNWCKFSVKAENNADYVADTEKLAASLPYVVAELVVLKPKVTLLPKAVWQQSLLQAAMRGASPCTHFVPVPQFNTTVVNCHLDSFTENGLRLRRELAGSVLAEWMRNLYGFHEEHAWRYLAFLDEALRGFQ
jgi:predicted nucleic acid-binding protein